jgi:acyl-coenzyme A synthetase/AMP-(fatty) acid ligase
VSAGEPINPEVTEQWRNRTGLDIYEGYGQTETVPDPTEKTGLDSIYSNELKPKCLLCLYDCLKDKGMSGVVSKP